MSLTKIIKRRPYTDYQKYKDVIPGVLQRLINTRRGDLTKIHEETGIPFSTLSRWHAELCINTSYNPLKRRWGMHCRIFTDEEEDAISDFILQNYILRGMHFTDEDFKTIALQAYDEKYLQNREEDIKIPDFHCSAGFIADFKYHHGFASKVFHIKRRTTPNSEIEKRFLGEIKTLFKEVPHDFILNCDETAWKLFPKGILTWGEVGRDNNSKQAYMNDKAQVTVLATISASRVKYPLLFVAQGKSAVVEDSQIGDVGPHWRTHTESGWITEEAFSFYLMKLREHVGHDETLFLIMDLYPAHMKPEVKELAASLNIKLCIIPAGATDLYQPLDRRVFGAMKAQARRLFKAHNTIGSPLDITKQQACADVVAAWEGLTAHLLGSAWSIYIEDENDSPASKECARLESHHRKEVERKREEMRRKRRKRRSIDE